MALLKVTDRLIKNYPSGMRNQIINGDFQIWQRGTSFVAQANGSHSADKWVYSKSGAMVHTVEQSTDVPTQAESGYLSKYSHLMDCTTADVSIAAGDVCAIGQRIEGHMYRSLQGKACTLSFWVKGTKTGIHCISFKNGGLDRSYVVEYTINTTNTWEKKSIPITFDNTAGTWYYDWRLGLEVNWCLAAGSTWHTTADAWQTGDFFATSSQVNACDNTANNFTLAQVQLEASEVATEFETRHVGFEQDLCARYYEKLSDALWTVFAIGQVWVAGVGSYVQIKFTQKRLAPAFSYSGTMRNHARNENRDVTSLIFAEITLVQATITVLAGGSTTWVAGDFCLLQAKNSVSSAIHINADL